MTNTRGYVALVARISQDRSGRVEGVKNQERWGRAYAARTWPGVPVKVFADNDISASDGSRRPEFERFRRALARGEVAHVWTVEQSRLTRGEVEWFALAAELDAAGITELHTNRDGIVRVGEEVAGIKAVLAAAEIRKLKRRVRERLDANAAKGRPAGSRPYGYVHGVNAAGDKTLTVVEDEATIIRESAERVLAGWSLTNIARDLRERGVHGAFQVRVTASGKRYTRAAEQAGDAVLRDAAGEPITRPGVITMNTVRSWITSPTVAGRRVHRGVDTGPGNWPAILDADTFAKIRNRLAAPRVVTTSAGELYAVPPQRGGTARRYLLSGGTAVCGVCGAPLVGTMKQRRKGGRLLGSVPYYACHPKTGGRGCVGVMAEPLEAHVVAELLTALDSPAFRRAMADDEHAVRRDALGVALSTLDVRRNDLARMWAAGELGGEEWAVARGGLADREAALRSELAELPPAVERVDLSRLREAWSLMTLDERREILAMFVHRVAVGRARPGAQGFDVERVAPADTWWRRRS